MSPLGKERRTKGKERKTKKRESRNRCKVKIGGVGVEGMMTLGNFGAFV